MHDHEEFLWTGLRARLERMGKVRPQTIRTEAVGQRPKRRHQEVPSNSAKAALRHELRAAAQPARVR
jgi:hypothetical protein